MNFFSKKKTQYTIVYGESKIEVKWWKELLKKVPNAVPLFLSIGTFYFGIVQYYYSQNLIDKRKYFNNYYDERYRILTELAKSTSNIYMIINESQDSILNDSNKHNIRKQMIIFNYAKLVLDKTKSDSIILKDIILNINQINYYLDNDLTNQNPRELYDSQKTLLEDAGHIFTNEKNTINSFKFNFWPFGENSSSDK